MSADVLGHPVAHVAVQVAYQIIERRGPLHVGLAVPRVLASPCVLSTFDEVLGAAEFPLLLAKRRDGDKVSHAQSVGNATRGHFAAEESSFLYAFAYRGLAGVRPELVGTRLEDTPFLVFGDNVVRLERATFHFHVDSKRLVCQ